MGRRRRSLNLDKDIDEFLEEVKNRYGGSKSEAANEIIGSEMIKRKRRQKRRNNR